MRAALIVTAVTAVTVVIVLASTPALAGKAGNAYESARVRATKAIKAATKQVDRVSSCAQTQSANIRDAQRQVNALKRSSPGDSYESINLFLGGLALGGALSSCPNELYGHLTAAQNAITDMRNEAAAASHARRPIDEEEDEEEDEDDDGADDERDEGVSIGAVDVDPAFIDQTRSPAILFHARSITAEGLDGTKVKWSLLVKRKSAKWKKAKSYSIGNARVQRGGALGDVSISVRYSTFERDGFSTGAHVAAIVGKVGRREVAREEVPFAIAAEDIDADDVVVARPRGGPAAMSAQAFAGFLSALNGTSTDYSKADMIKKAAAKNHFTAQQLGQMLDTLSTDFSKVDAAKAVVPRLVDAQNAYGLADKFSTSFSKQEFTALL